MFVSFVLTVSFFSSVSLNWKPQRSQDAMAFLPEEKELLTKTP